MNLNFLNTAIDIFYPKRCIFCEDVLDVDYKNVICEKCSEEIKYVGEININESAYSHDDSIYFDKVWCVYEYDFVKKAIEYFKFKSFKSYCNPIGSFMYEYGINNSVFENIDVLTAVPIHKSRRRERGFNHAEEMVKVLSDKTHIPYNFDIIKRIRKTKPMYNLDVRHRRDNIKNAFACFNEDFIKGKNILLIDDIFTTGRTANECAKVFKNAGAKNVFVFCFSYS